MSMSEISVLLARRSSFTHNFSLRDYLAAIFAFIV